VTLQLVANAEEVEFFSLYLDFLSRRDINCPSRRLGVKALSLNVKGLEI
jgi:hypothetical protein